MIANITTGGTTIRAVATAARRVAADATEWSDVVVYDATADGVVAMVGCGVRDGVGGFCGAS